MSETNAKKNGDTGKMDRRKFLRIGGIAAAATVVGGIVGCKKETNNPGPSDPGNTTGGGGTTEPAAGLTTNGKFAVYYGEVAGNSQLLSALGQYPFSVVETSYVSPSMLSNAYAYASICDINMTVATATQADHTTPLNPALNRLYNTLRAIKPDANGHDGFLRNADGSIHHNTSNGGNNDVGMIDSRNAQAYAALFDYLTNTDLSKGIGSYKGFYYDDIDYVVQAENQNSNYAGVRDKALSMLKDVRAKNIGKKVIMNGGFQQVLVNGNPDPNEPVFNAIVPYIDGFSKEGMYYGAPEVPYTPATGSDWLQGRLDALAKAVATAPGANKSLPFYGIEICTSGKQANDIAEVRNHYDTVFGIVNKKYGVSLQPTLYLADGSFKVANDVTINLPSNTALGR